MKKKLDISEEEIEYHWNQFKKKLEEIFDKKTASKYENEDPSFVVDIYLKPHLKNVQQILLDEDVMLGGK